MVYLCPAGAFDRIGLVRLAMAADEHDVKVPGWPREKVTWVWDGRVLASIKTS